MAIRIEAMRESLEQLGRFDPVRARERFRVGFEPQATRHIIFAGSRVGFFVVKDSEADLLLDHLYIRPQFQNLGIGAAVLSQVIREAEGRGVPLRVAALRGSRANDFYTRHGFEKSGEGEWDIYYVRPGGTRGR